MWGPCKSPRVVSGPRAGYRLGAKEQVGKVFFVSHVAEHGHTIHGLKNRVPSDMRGTQIMGPSFHPITGRVIKWVRYDEFKGFLGIRFCLCSGFGYDATVEMAVAAQSGLLLKAFAKNGGL